MGIGYSLGSTAILIVEQKNDYDYQFLEVKKL
jgi:hypothetical protein